jgi:peroxiredoxin
MKKLFVALFAIVTFFSTSAFAADSQKLPLPEAMKDSLPWFAVRELQNDNSPFTRVHLQRLAQKNDRVALVYFATWCIPCRAGIKQVVAHQAEIEKAGTAIVLVNVGERETAKVKNFLTKLSADKIASVTDPYGRLTEGFGLVKEGQNISLPRTSVVDKSMKVLQLIGEEGDDYIKLLMGK